MSRLLGLDIGGTLSRARVCVDGDVVAEAEAASASLTAAGADGATAALAGLLAQLPLAPQIRSVASQQVIQQGPAQPQYASPRQLRRARRHLNPKPHSCPQAESIRPITGR